MALDPGVHQGFAARLHRVLITSGPRFPHRQILVCGDVFCVGCHACVGMDNSEWDVPEPTEKEAADQEFLGKCFFLGVFFYR